MRPNFFLLLFSFFPVFFALTFAPHSSFAQDSAPLSIDEALQQIQQEQNVTSKTDIDCTKITDAQYALLGKAVVYFLDPSFAEPTNISPANWMEKRYSAIGKKNLPCSATAAKASSCRVIYNSTPRYSSPSQIPPLMTSAVLLGSVLVVILIMVSLAGFLALLKYLVKNPRS